MNDNAQSFFSGCNYLCLLKESALQDSSSLLDRQR